MSPDAAEQAPRGQDGPIDQTQLPPAESAAQNDTADTAPANSINSINPLTTINSWETASSADRLVVIQALERYYKAAGLEEGKEAGSKAKVLLSSTDHPSQLLYQAARLMQSPERTVPHRTLRLTVQGPTQEADKANRRVHVNQLREKLFSHFNGSALLPYFKDIKIEGTEWEGLVGGVAGIALHKVNAPPGQNPSYEMDISFHSPEAFQSALKKPFVHKGLTSQMDIAIPPNLSGVVELRMELKALNLPDAAIAKGISTALGSQPRLSILKIVKYFDNVKMNKEVSGLVFTGRISVFVQVSDIRADIDGKYRHTLYDILPRMITFASDTLPLRHNYEEEYCHRCHFAGHSGPTCPKFPCSACNKHGHISTQCRNPTRRQHTAQVATHPPVTPRQEGTWEQVTGNRAKHLPRTPLSANQTPLNKNRYLNRFGLLNNQEGEGESETGEHTPRAIIGLNTTSTGQRRRAAPSTTSSTNERPPKKALFAVDTTDEINFPPLSFSLATLPSLP
ncbi:uncharacterized protein JCM6883_003614 [Sporobolomyces salmoneus]|uniref:uncharacterized protein n=1 Tax=Sporobolomyces salmoneus TaxID=183962 RepID=UPI00316FD314